VEVEQQPSFMKGRAKYMLTPLNGRGDPYHENKALGRITKRIQKVNFQCQKNQGEIANIKTVMWMTKKNSYG
jgi:hypothetical protein